MLYFLGKILRIKLDIYLFFSCSLISLTVILRFLKSESKNRVTHERKVVFHSSELQSMAKN